MSAGPETTPVGRRRRGRDRLPRRVVQKVRLSEVEHRELRERAAALGVSVPRLMVEAALDGRETPTERRNELATLFEIRRVLATVANNVNQLARSANIAGQVSEQRRLEETLREVDEVVADLRQLLGARR